MKTLILSLFLILLGGCANTYRQEGSELVEPSEISIVDTNACQQHGCPIIQEVDDKWRGTGTFKRYELMPGVRKLRLIYMANGVTASRAFVVKFRALPGRAYTMRSNVNFSTITWNPEVLDAITQEVVSKQMGLRWPTRMSPEPLPIHFLHTG